MYTAVWAPCSMPQPSTEGNRTCHLPGFLFVRHWLLAEQPETLMQWFAFVQPSVKLELNPVETSLVFC